MNESMRTVYKVHTNYGRVFRYEMCTHDMLHALIAGTNFSNFSKLR